MKSSRSPDDEALDWMKALAAKEGPARRDLLGAAVAAVDKADQAPGIRQQTIVVLLPDTVERYLGTTIVDAEAVKKTGTQRE